MSYFQKRMDVSILCNHKSLNFPQESIYGNQSPHFCISHIFSETDVAIDVKWYIYFYISRNIWRIHIRKYNTRWYVFDVAIIHLLLIALVVSMRVSGVPMIVILVKQDFSKQNSQAANRKMNSGSVKCNKKTI